MKWIMGRLDRLLTALALAEAGDLDTVRQMLREDTENNKNRQETVHDAARDKESRPVVPAA